MSQTQTDCKRCTVEESCCGCRYGCFNNKEPDVWLYFPNSGEQKEQFFGSDGVAVAAAESLGLVFKKAGAWNVDQKIGKVITGEYLD